MSDEDVPQGAPPAGEEIHMPASSIQPLLLAIGLTLALVGVTLSWFVCALGGALSIVVIVQWIAQTRRDIGELPVEHE